MPSQCLIAKVANHFVRFWSNDCSTIETKCDVISSSASCSCFRVMDISTCPTLVYSYCTHCVAKTVCQSAMLTHGLNILYISFWHSRTWELRRVSTSMHRLPFRHTGERKIRVGMTCCAGPVPHDGVWQDICGRQPVGKIRVGVTYWYLQASRLEWLVACPFLSACPGPHAAQPGCVGHGCALLNELGDDLTRHAREHGTCRHSLVGSSPQGEDGQARAVVAPHLRDPNVGKDGKAVE